MAGMKLQFTKMHGLGNDFVVLDGIHQALDLTPAQWKVLADRHFGVGADQILIVEKAQGDADFRYRIFNSDGGEVEQCGNGARCFVRFVHDKGLTAKRAIRVETLGGLIEPRLEDNGLVTVNMGVPGFAPDALPFNASRASPAGEAHGYWLSVESHKVNIGIVSMGNPHAVQIVADVDTAPVGTQGPLIEGHAAFPKRVNAGYMQIVSRTHIRLRVYERGAGETLACGSGACGAVVTGIERGLLEKNQPVRVTTRGGDLLIRWDGAGTPVEMTGPAVTVFEGEITL
jgi:diaminopimelate epimerase